MRRKIALLMVLTVFSITACGKKEATVDEPAEVEDMVEKQDTKDESKEESEVEVDSKNAYEYSKLESILQELKRETDAE